MSTSAETIDPGTQPLPAGPAPETLDLPLDQLVLDSELQSRIKLDQDTIESYCAAFRARDVFPPITVYSVGESYLVVDGFHRVAAARLAKLEGLAAEVHRGDRRAALLHAVGANSTHGLHRTNADKRRAVEILLKDTDWAQWSDHKIGKLAGTSDRFVAKTRKRLSANGSQIEAPERLSMRGGKAYKMRVEGINQGRAEQKDCPREPGREDHLAPRENSEPGRLPQDPTEDPLSGESIAPTGHQRVSSPHASPEASERLDCQARVTGTLKLDLELLLPGKEDEADLLPQARQRLFDAVEHISDSQVREGLLRAIQKAKIVVRLRARGQESAQEGSEE